MAIGGVFCNDPLKGSDYHLSQHWLSAMSQGYSLAIMIEAYEITKNKSYLKLAEKILNSFSVSIVDGGIRSDWGTTIWYDEYPTTPQKHVLNGFIYSLAGLYTYYEYTGDAKAKKLFDDGITALREHLSEFDAGFNSYYSQSENQQTYHGIASATGVKYQALHIMQLLWIYSITNDIFFKNWANKFIQQDFGDIKNYQVSNKFKSIKASHTIDPKKHGTNRLNDTIWTYGAYWSTYKFPTILELEFTRTANDVKSFILVSTGAKIPETSFDIYVLQKNEWQKVNKKLIDSYENKTRHFKALVMKYDFGEYYNQVKKMKVVFLKHSEKVLALREINVFFDMSLELENLLNKY